MVATEVEKEFSEEMRQVGLNLSSEMLSKCELLHVTMNVEFLSSRLQYSTADTVTLISNLTHRFSLSLYIS
jgi:hypothetical protein